MKVKGINSIIIKYYQAVDGFKDKMIHKLGGKTHIEYNEMCFEMIKYREELHRVFLLGFREAERTRDVLKEMDDFKKGN